MHTRWYYLFTCLSHLITLALALDPNEQHPFSIRRPTSESSPSNLVDPISTPFEAFLDEFRFPAISTSIHLHQSLRHLFPSPTYSLTVTSSPNFNLPLYCSNSAHKATMRKLDEAESMVQMRFVPPKRRMEGSGVLGEEVDWAGYEVDVGLDGGREKFTVFSASWREANGLTHQQSYIVSTSSKDLAEAFMLQVMTYEHSIRDSILVFDQSRWEADHELWENVQKANWKDVILDSDLKDSVQHEYKSFFKSEHIYKNLGVPWKRGVIFLGPPGNGKTISLKAIMKESGVPSLYVKTFHTYNGDEYGIKMIFSRARAEAPCILILEDLDSLITDANRSFFLNEVDGLEGNDGLLIIGTTNHFDRLDPALSNRPSRFDRKYTFPDPILSERLAYAKYWQHKLAGNKDIDFPDSLCEEVANKTEKFSFAYLKEAFVATLLRIASDESTDPPSFRKTLLEQIKWLKEQLTTHPEARFLAEAMEGEGPEGVGEVVRWATPGGVTRAKVSMARPVGMFEGPRSCKR